MDRRRIVAVHAPDLAPVAIDLQTRCAELGLADVELVDHRDFAHGRHVGLARRAAETTVLDVAGEPFADLAEATVRLLPDEVEVVSWRPRETGPAASIELLMGSIQLAQLLAERQGVVPARPGVPTFGRRLYHLTSAKRLIAGSGVFAGLNTMYGAVVGRVRELATLQTLGFVRRAIGISLIQEGTLLAAAASLLAAALAMGLLNGLAIRFTMGAFTLRIDSVALMIGCGTGLLLGVIGALPPAARALRLPVAESLKAI